MNEPRTLCVFSCGRPVAKNSKRLCASHLKHQRLKMAAYRARRKEQGLCSRCDNPARILPDGRPSTLCEDCRARVRKLEQKQRKAEKKLLKKN